MITTIVSLVLICLTTALSAPVVIMAVEIFAAVLKRRPTAAPKLDLQTRATLVVLVPAHNESAGILPTLGDISAQLRPGDRMVVVADNCSDDTASVAKSAGAEVIERMDPNRHGKGYALDFGIDHLRASPPQCVIVVDADCRLQDGVLDILVSSCTRHGRPAQALNLLHAPDTDQSVAEFAWRVRNWVRPLGLKTMHLPCQLNGTGMAFPWNLISTANLACANIVEDLKLGLDLAAAGAPPVFCPEAGVYGYFSRAVPGMSTQRARWEYGHLRMIGASPAYLLKAIFNGDTAMLALALDLTVPPLTLLALLQVVSVAVTTIGLALGLGRAPFVIAVLSTVLMFLAIFLAWCRFGRDLLGLNHAVRLGKYILSKVLFYPSLLARRGNQRWHRADRG